MNEEDPKGSAPRKFQLEHSPGSENYNKGNKQTPLPTKHKLAYHGEGEATGEELQEYSPSHKTQLAHSPGSENYNKGNKQTSLPTKHKLAYHGEGEATGVRSKGQRPLAQNATCTFARE